MKNLIASTSKYFKQINNYLFSVKKYVSLLFNTRAGGLYILLFAASIGIATFIENDFGTSAAQKVIFKAWWFELLLALFGISIIVNIFKFRMIPQKKWTVLLFHASIIVILIGAGITRYFGFEGVMHIRENDASNTFLSSNTYLKFNVTKNNQTYDFNEPVLFASLGNNNWHQSYLVDSDLIDIKVKQFIPNPKQAISESMDGKPILKIVSAGMNGREEYLLSYGETKRYNNVLFNFNSTLIPEAININYRNDSLVFSANRVLTQLVMATQKKDTIYPSSNYKPLMLRSLYSDGENNFVFPEFIKNGKATIESESSKVKNESTSALVLDVSVNGKVQEAYVYGSRGMPGRSAFLSFEGTNVAVSYGSKEVELPFSIYLKKFIMDKYPGTDSASSYASEVVLMDDRNDTKMDFRIFMNNILNYGGYRFFQSSFDKDEKGTYLSVNSDYWGTLISYLGYILLTIGLLLNFFSKKTRFYDVLQKLKKIRAKNGAFIILLFISFSSTVLIAQTPSTKALIEHAVSKEHAEKFSKLVVQDFKGRMKPLHTLSREVMRKVYRKESFAGLNSDQIVLSMFANGNDWSDAKIIKLGKHQDILTQLGVMPDYASYRDFFNEKGDYKLRDEIRRVYDLDPKDRGVYEKELIKIDERLNIVSMMFSGSLLKVIPVANDVNNTWVSRHNHGGGHENHVSDNFFSAYKNALIKGIQTKNFNDANSILDELKAYQIKNGSAVIPSNLKN